MNIEQLAIKNLEAQIEIYGKIVASYQSLLSEIQQNCYDAHKRIVSGEPQSDLLKSMSSDVFRATSNASEYTKNIYENTKWLQKLQP